MKTDTHPDYVECEVACGCGETFVTRATTPSIRVEVCSKCHPFYTGKQKLVDSAGRVEKFQKRWGSHIEAQKARMSGAEQSEQAEQAQQPDASAQAEQADEADQPDQDDQPDQPE